MAEQTALMLLNAARTAADPAQRPVILHQFHELMKREPLLLPTFYPHALGLAVDPSPQLRSGLARLVEDTICRMTIPDESKLLVSARSVEALVFLLNDGNAEVIKRVIRSLTSIYPIVFKWLCRLPADPTIWQNLATLKGKAFGLLVHFNDGVRESVVRFLHRLTAVQSLKDDSVAAIGVDGVSLDLVPPNHPFINAAEMSTEAVGVFARLQAFLNIPGVSAGPLTANINCLGGLMKIRPQYTPAVLTTLIQWAVTPSPLTPTQRRSVERTIKIVLLAALRMNAAAPFMPVLTEALMKLGAKPHELQSRRRDLKRPAPSEVPPVTDTKRPRTDTPPVDTTSAGLQTPAASLPPDAWKAIDVTKLPAALVAQLVVQILASCNQSDWERGLQRFSDFTSTGRAPLQPGNLQIAEGSSSADTTIVKQEPHNPLEQDDIEEELDSGIYKEATPVPLAAPGADASKAEPVDTSPQEDEMADIDEQARSAVFTMSDEDKAELTHEQRAAIIKGSVARILQLETAFMGQNAVAVNGTDATSDAAIRNAASAKNAWMVILSRLTTRLSGRGVSGGTEGHDLPSGQKDEIKTIIVETLLEDFRGRLDLAVMWLHHLWLSDQKSLHADSPTSDGQESLSSSEYAKWLHIILDSLKEKLDHKDKTFAKFLIDVPEVTPEAIDNVVRGYCESAERMQLGLFTLQGLINHRPAVRDHALRLLLDYSVYSVRLTRSTAIVMCKRIYSDHKVLGQQIEMFAIECLHKLKTAPPIKTVVVSEETMEVKPEQETDRTGGTLQDVVGNIQVKKEVNAEDMKPVQSAANEWHDDDVIPLLELYFALCSKNHDLLLEVFHLYKDYSPPVQRALRTGIEPLIKALAAQPARLYPIIRAFPAGSDALALKVLTCLTEKATPTPQLVGIVRTVFVQKHLSAHFIIPVMSMLNKKEVLQYLPNIVNLLDGTETQRKHVREAFLRMVDASPAELDASSPTSEKAPAGNHVTPSELLVLLHNMEETVGLKRAVEATSICLAAQNVFKQEVLAVVLQQLVDQSKLPTLFMRTVIQTVNQFPGLTNFVANILLKLINKKVWKFQKLWEGFIRCCTIIFPSSTQLLQSLPREQAQDALKRSPKLKHSLNEYLTNLSPEERVRRERDVVALKALLGVDGEADGLQVKMERGDEGER